MGNGRFENLGAHHDTLHNSITSTFKKPARSSIFPLTEKRTNGKVRSSPQEAKKRSLTTKKEATIGHQTAEAYANLG